MDDLKQASRKALAGFGKQLGVLVRDLFKLVTHVLVPLVVVVAVVWWFNFGTFSACEAFGAEARRISAKEAGVLGSIFGGADIRTDDLSPMQCAVGAVRLKWQGSRALEEMRGRGR